MKKAFACETNAFSDIAARNYLVAVVSIATVIESVAASAVVSAGASISAISMVSLSTSVAALLAELPAQDARTNAEQIVAKVKIFFISLYKLKNVLIRFERANLCQLV
ncbi:MAG: hypothetical protein K2L01_01045 [Rikenellaceae bacterium]|nr:hypothetical protein [Rikenellaceae bacterium]